VDALYDLGADPDEKRNLARERQDVVTDLRGKLDALEAESVDAEPIPEEDEAILSARLEELGYL